MINCQCPNCKEDSGLYPARLKPISDINTNVLLFKTGNAVTIAELMVLFKLRKVGSGWECNKCHFICVQCPYFLKLQKVKPIDYTSKICINCKKRYYAII